MDFMTPAPDFVIPETPHFIDEARILRTVLGSYSVAEIMKTMQVSRPLAESVAVMYANDATRKPALWAYTGDVFKGFQAATLDEGTATFAQQHLLIASGLYGAVHPYDEIAPYRLEMKARIAVGQTRDIYNFWGEKVARYVEGLSNLGSELCVLSSEEYAKPVTQYASSSVRIVTPAFIDRKPDGTDAQIPIYNKMMRGVMARWIMDRRIDHLEFLDEFAAHGYAYVASMSTPAKPVFYRTVMRPLRFNETAA